MAKRRTDSNRQHPRRRRDLTTWLMMLLPGFMFVGLLAPAAVSVKPKAEEGPGPISFRNFAPRRPIQLPVAIGRDVLPNTGPEAVFSGARYLAEQAQRVFEPDVAAQGDDNQIVLSENEDNVENNVAETLFEAPVEDPQQLVVDLTPLWDPAVFDVIPGLISRNGWSQWDDFHGTGIVFPQGGAPGTVIPEPATGGLLALGLAALAMRRKRD